MNLSSLLTLFEPELVNRLRSGSLGSELSRRIHELTDDEQKMCSIDLLNCCLTKRYTSSNLRLSNDSIVSIDAVFSLMQELPFLKLLFDPSFMTRVSDNSVLTLEPIFRDFITQLLDAPRSDKNETLLAQFCVLSWRECFTLPSQCLMANIISHILISRIATCPLSWPFLMDGSTFVSSGLCSCELVIVSVLRLLDKCLHQFLPSSDLNNQTHDSQSHKQNLIDLGELYEASFSELSQSSEEDWPWTDYDLEAFLKGALLFVHEAFKFSAQLTFSHSLLSNFVPKVQADSTLFLRLSLGFDFYLVRACRHLLSLPDLQDHFPSLGNKPLTDRDVTCLRRIPVLRQLNDELILCRPALEGCEYAHHDLVAWAIDHDILVKDFAMAILKTDVFNDAVYSAKVLPRLTRHVGDLAVDYRVALLLIQRLSSLRQKFLPTNHHMSLLHHLMPLLSATSKSEILARLHTRSEQCPTPLSPEESKFRSCARNFFNRLAASPGLSDLNPSSFSRSSGRPWAPSGQPSNIISTEALIDADLLLLTRPIDFLTELLYFPITQHSAALLPVVFTILSHVSYSLDIHLNGEKVSVARRLLAKLMALFEAEEEEGEQEAGEEQGVALLMRYLPMTGDLDPLQVALAAQASAFSNPVSMVSADDNAGLHSGRGLWTLCFACLFDQPTVSFELADLVASTTHAEVVVQSLSLLLLPSPPAHLPDVHLVTLCRRLLDHHPTPLVVKMCVSVLAQTRASDTLGGHLRSVLAGEQNARLLMQCADFLPNDLLGLLRIPLPYKLVQSRLVDVAALNESTKCHFEFTPAMPQPEHPLCHFAQPLSPSDLEEIFEVVSLSDGTWLALVNSFMVSSSKEPEIRSLWNRLSASSVILSLYAFLHRICSTDGGDVVGRWARAVGFVDQLVVGGLLHLAFSTRNPPTTTTATLSDTTSPPPDIHLGHHRGSLDLFDLVFGLLRVIDRFGAKPPSPMLGLVCQTLAVIGQRLVSRFATAPDAVTSDQVQVLVEQAVLVIEEIEAYIRGRGEPTTPPLEHLLASLDLVLNSLSRKQDQESPCT
uniref:Non-specific serine/threonine protein kinase n=2 Tax=Mesocestoides corti TaxID=53468 RepID=A0A5K3F552_MESCO